MSAASIVAAFRVVLIAVDVVWGLYLVLMPVAELVASPVWREAFRVVPWHSPDLLGFAFLLGPVLAAGTSFYSSTHLAGRVAYVSAGVALGFTGACWGLTGVSWLAAAFELRGSGSGSAAVAFGLVALHGLLAFERRARHVLHEPRQRKG